MRKNWTQREAFRAINPHSSEYNQRIARISGPLVDAGFGQIWKPFLVDACGPAPMYCQLNLVLTPQKFTTAYLLCEACRT